MKPTYLDELEETLKAISADRDRTNLLRKPEQNALAWLVIRIPSWVNSDMLTSFGLFGSLVVLASFILAAYIRVEWLLLGILGLLINWFGDSLDGRVAIYRKRSRKWYGFALDLITDWLSIILIGLGYIIYSDGMWELLGYGFVVLYGWAIMTTLLKYKIFGEYEIDPGLFGPTEGRVLVSLILLFEVLIPGSIVWTVAGLTAFIFFVNLFDTAKLLRLADIHDKKEKLKASVPLPADRFIQINQG